jgi:hypothetical protein
MLLRQPVNREAMYPERGRGWFSTANHALIMPIQATVPDFYAFRIMHWSLSLTAAGSNPAAPTMPTLAD